MVAKGMSYKQIAERLVISHRTVQNHVQNTLRKLQMHNRVELTRYAIERGLDGDDELSGAGRSPDDADALADLERDANLVALAHVFPARPVPVPLGGRARALGGDAGRAGRRRGGGRRRRAAGGVRGPRRRDAAPPGRPPRPVGRGAGDGSRSSGRWPPARPGCGAWSTTTGPAPSTTTSATSRPAPAGRRRGRRTPRSWSWRAARPRGSGPAPRRRGRRRRCRRRAG